MDENMDELLDEAVLDNLITTQRLIVQIFDKTADTSRDIYLLQALKEYQALRDKMKDN